MGKQHERNGGLPARDLDPTDDWATLEGLAAVRRRLEAVIDGWRPPVAWGVALDGEVGHANLPGGQHGLAAVVLAAVLKHDGATATLPMTRDELDEAIRALQPAEACLDVPHPNLAAWRALAAAYDEDGGSIEAVFVRDLGDPVGSAADEVLRAAVP